MRYVMRSAFFLFFVSMLIAPVLTAQTIPVALKKSLWPDARGELSITPQGLTFKEATKENSLTWPYQDIQTIDRRSRTEFAILTYDNQW